MTQARLFTAMVTPFRSDLSLDLAATKALASMLAEDGSEGLVVAGSTGESATLDDDEKLALFTAVLEAVGDRVLVFANTGSNDTARSVALSRRAAALGVHGLMAVVPYYNRPSQAGMHAHFSAIAEATDLPLMLYNVPARTGSNLLPETAARLAAEHPTIQSVKEAAGSLDQAAELCRLLPPGTAVYSGDDSLTLPMLSVGAAGVVSVASHLVGRRIRQMILAALAGDQPGALAIHRQLLPLFRGLFLTPNPSPVKAALNLTGHPVGPCRLPLVPLGADESSQLCQLLLASGLSIAR